MRGCSSFRAALLALPTLGLVGCSVYGLATTWSGFQDQQSTSALATHRLFELSGSVKLPDSLLSGKPLAQFPELATGSPLLNVAAIAGVHLYPQSIAPSLVTALGTVRDAPLQFVDTVTGAVVATTSTDANGHYSYRLSFEGSQRPFVLQTILRNSAGQVVGFLAAPLGVNVADPTGKKAVVDLSPATTMLAFSATLLSEIYPSFDCSTGFVGVVSARLAAMVRSMPPAKTQAAAALLDQSRTLSGEATFQDLLSDTATASAVMTFEVRKLAQQAMATDSLAVEAPALNAAILSQLVARIGQVKDPGAAGGSQGFLDSVASQVDLTQAKADSAAEQASLPVSLPPLPSPTPAQGVDVVFQ